MNMTTNNKVYRLGRRPGVQGPRPQPSDRGCVGKSVTGNRPQQQLDGKAKGLRVAKEELTVGTWNVRTLWATGQLELLQKENVQM